MAWLALGAPAVLPCVIEPLALLCVCMGFMVISTAPGESNAGAVSPPAELAAARGSRGPSKARRTTSRTDPPGAAPVAGAAPEPGAVPSSPPCHGRQPRGMRPSQDRRADALPLAADATLPGINGDSGLSSRSGCSSSSWVSISGAGRSPPISIAAGGCTSESSEGVRWWCGGTGGDGGAAAARPADSGGSNAFIRPPVPSNAVPGVGAG